MSAADDLARAHKLAAQAVGLLSAALTRKKISPEVAARCVRQWRQAADIVERIILKKE